MLYKSCTRPNSAEINAKEFKHFVHIFFCVLLFQTLLWVFSQLLILTKCLKKKTRILFLRNGAYLYDLVDFINHIHTPLNNFLPWFAFSESFKIYCVR